MRAPQQRPQSQQQNQQQHQHQLQRYTMDLTPNHSRNSSGDTGADFCDGEECPGSPSAWICDFGAGKRLQQLCFPSVRPFMSGNKSVRMGKGIGSDSSSQSDTSVASWRARAADKILGVQGRGEAHSDDEVERGRHSDHGTAGGRAPLPSRRAGLSPKSNDSQSISTTASHGGLDNNEPRIVAPNVSKLSPVRFVPRRRCPLTS